MRKIGTLGIVFCVVLVGCGPSNSIGNTNGNDNDNGNDNNNDNNNGNSNNTNPFCGDGVHDSFEDCDGADLGGATCVTEGLTGGVLSCALDCSFNLSGCTGCGNGTAEGSDPVASGYEVCDSTDLRGEDCGSQGFAWGTLACLSSCDLDTSGCHTDPAVCGDGVAEDQEVCDGPDLGGASCTSLGMGFTGGVLGCNSGCMFDTSGCITCGDGVVGPGEVCDDGNTVDDLTCSAGCTMACGPGYSECSGDTSTQCAWDGSGVVTEYCDPLMGSSCDAGTGRCVGPCSLDQLGSSYIGCDYYPTITRNSQLTLLLPFKVAVSNSGVSAANVNVTQGAATLSTTVVAPGDIVLIALPWTTLRSVGTTTMVVDGAYRVRTDQPVTVYQYSPLDYTNGSGGYTYTNDAALLLPTNTWTGNYRVVSRAHWANYNLPGFYAVTAAEDNTTVILTPSATGGSVSAGAGVAANGTGSVLLNAGDVLQVLSTGGDLTGTLVSANGPVQVIGGHDCTNVPANVGYCDHLEEAIPPLETVGFDYLVTVPLINASSTKARMVRVVATQPNTTITYDPPQGGAPTSLANAGDFFEINQTSADFMISASDKVLVAEYFLGQDAGGGTGDPAMTLAVAMQQYRNYYLFHAPTNYEANYVNITAITGATVTLDGGAVPLASFTPIGASGYSVARVQLSNGVNGNHTISSPTGIGISVYGYGQYTSYWYPGGLNLSDI